MSVSQVSVSLSGVEAGVLAVLLPHLAAVAVDRAEISGGLVSIWVHATAGGAACPGCGTWCTAVRDRYVRRLRDAAAGGRRVLVWLVVRLLRCGNPGCPKASFAEQPEGLAVPYARKTSLLAGQLAAVAAALCGRAGSRLARAVLAVEVSRHTLIRVLMALPEPAAGLVRVLGIDDFSLKKGREYATLLVNMETGEPVDVLPDREAGTRRNGCAAHPEVEVICRDRAGAYAEAARDGAPQRDPGGRPVAHLAQPVRVRRQGCRPSPGLPGRIRLRPPGRAGRPAGAGAGEGALPAGRPSSASGTHAVHELRAAGKTLAETAAALGLSEQLTGRFWRAASAGALLEDNRGASALDP